MTQPRRRIHILSDSQVRCSLLLLPPLLLLFLHPTEERERERPKDSCHSLPPPLSPSVSLPLFFTLFVDDGILIMWKTAERLFWISLTLRLVPPGLF